MNEGGEERETKLRVDAGFVLPDFSQLDGVAVDDRGERRLHAVYFDTAEHALGRAGAGLRRRDGVWTFKGQARRDGDAVVREELEEPGGEEVPARIQERIAQWTDPGALGVMAELETLRHTLDVRHRQERAEVVHDRVRVLDAGREVAAFCEVEVECGAAGTDLAGRLVALLREGGAVVDPTPKLARALRALGAGPDAPGG